MVKEISDSYPPSDYSTVLPTSKEEHKHFNTARFPSALFKQTREILYVAVLLLAIDGKKGKRELEKTIRNT